MEQFFDRGMHKIQAIYSCWGYFDKIDSYYYLAIAIILHYLYNSGLQPTKNLLYIHFVCYLSIRCKGRSHFNWNPALIFIARHSVSLFSANNCKTNR